MAGEIRVLVVDDDPSFADLTANFLERDDERIDVVTEESAADGLSRLERAAVDCVVSDHDMPGRNGIEFLDDVRSEFPDLPFILFTGKGSEKVASEAISRGVTDYLQKETGTDQYTVLANRIRNAVERTRTKERLAESQGRYRSMTEDVLDTSSIGMIVADGDGAVVWVNETIEAYFGLDREAVLDREVRDVFETAVLPTLDHDEPFEGTSGPGIAAEEPIACRVTDGPGRDERWLEYWSQPIESGFFEGGCIEQFSDVTARKERELELERYEQLVESVPVPIFETRTDGSIVDVNEAFVETFGGDSVASMRRRSATDLWPDVEARDELVEQVLRTGTVQRALTRMRTVDGEEMWIEVTMTVAEGDGSRHLEGICHEVTDRVRQERELERHESLVSRLPVGVFRTTPDGEFIEYNRALLDVFDAESPERIEALDPEELYEDPADRERIIERARREGPVVEETRLRTVDGDPFRARQNVRHVEDGDDEFLEGIVSDLDRRERTG